MTERKIQFQHLRGFSLVELCCSIGIISLLISMILPVLASVRADARKKVCMGNARAIGQFHAMYSAEFKDSFATWLEKPEVYAADRARWREYSMQSLTVMCRPPWYAFTGLHECSKVFHCPAAQYGRTPETNDDGSSYQMSSPVYCTPAFLDPATPSQAMSNVFGGRTQTQSAVVYPSLKVIVFEWHVWHDWSGALVPGAEAGTLEWGCPSRKPSLAFADGHVEQRSSRGVPYVWRPSHWGSGPFRTTPMGLAGADYGTNQKPSLP